MFNSDLKSILGLLEYIFSLWSITSQEMAIELPFIIPLRLNRHCASLDMYINYFRFDGGPDLK